MSEKQTEVVKFLNFLSNPNALSSNDLGEIKDWVEKYPYSQSLKFIAVKAAQKDSNYPDLLAEAATIAPSRKILHDLIHQPINFVSLVLPFTLEDNLSIEERQRAVASEENLEGIEDKSKFTFGINLNEIYGSEYQIKKPEEESPVEGITEEIQEEEISAIADEEILEEESSVENIEEVTQEEISAFADVEVIKETEEESSVENIEEKEQEEISAIAAEEVIIETEKDPALANIEEYKQEEISASPDQELIDETEEESPIENIEAEEKLEEISASTDNEVIVETDEESSVENIEAEEKLEEISASTDNEVIVETEEDSALANIEEEEQEEILASGEEEVEEETEIENIEEEKHKEVIASTDEDQIEEVQETEEETRIGNIEEEEKQEEILASTDEEVLEEESTVENIKEEEQEEILASTDTEVLEEESTVENIEGEKQEEISASADEEPVVETDESTMVENIEEVVEESIVENIEEETSKEEEKPIQKEEPAFQYAPQTGFFALNRKDKVEEKQDIEPELKADESVSAYNDERMPYTFLWWLNKTRKEHANTQPYSSFKLDTTRQIKAQETDGLNHQIAENIFHLRGAEELSSSATNYTVPFDFRKKEFQIIEKFIKEEPQIRPPAANKIDSENKAKKSSEDKNQVVSETLAKIYVEQMLYHKALDVYKKLSLKFPEKSTYFASQIKYLELKVN